MNVDNLRLLATTLRSPEAAEHFYIGTWSNRGKLNRKSLNSCGTTACIAGWAAVLAHPDDTFVDDIERTAARFLGVSVFGDIAHDLFMGWPTDAVTPAEAADVVDHLAETGEVDWARFVKHDEEA